MKLLNFRSLEGAVTVCFIFISLLILSLLLILGCILQWKPLTISMLLGAGVLILWLFFKHLYELIFIAFRRASLHLESINNQDYLQYAKPAFSQGQVSEFHRELEQLSSNLQQLKSRYDQNVFLVYRLIEQLDSPIMIFNQHHQLTYANEAFNALYSQPWQMYKYSSPELLGIEFIDDTWHFQRQQQDKLWQIRHSEFIEQGKTHQLIVFVNIESALRKNQLTAWQQLIRVLGHEIRNSLTPVSALAQGLEAKLTTSRDKQAAAVIHERCRHLQDFVGRYASVSKPFQLHHREISLAELGQRLQHLLKDIKLTIDYQTESLWADPALIEQVLLNLIKNAHEASTADDTVRLTFSATGQASLIEVIDSGHGFANLDNLFVPLYTTKRQGQGVGLPFCRNIIEQHQGNISLTNNVNTSGVTVSISLPLKPKEG